LAWYPLASAGAASASAAAASAAAEAAGASAAAAGGGAAAALASSLAFIPGPRGDKLEGDPGEPSNFMFSHPLIKSYASPFVIEVVLNKSVIQTHLMFFFQAFEWRIMLFMSRNESIRCENGEWPNFGRRSFSAIIYLFLRRKRQKKWLSTLQSAYWLIQRQERTDFLTTELNIL
jgi:hypothetical protein